MYIIKSNLEQLQDDLLFLGSFGLLIRSSEFILSLLRLLSIGGMA